MDSNIRKMTNHPSSPNKKCKKLNQIQLAKNKIDLNNRKITIICSGNSKQNTITNFKTLLNELQ